MPHNPPINLRELGKKGLLDTGRFYGLLSQKCNYMDEESVKTVYLGLVKLISEQLRENDVIRLPHLGDFALVPQAPRSQLIGRGRQFMAGMKVLKFYPKYAWRQYFNTRGKQQL